MSNFNINKFLLTMKVVCEMSKTMTADFEFSLNINGVYKIGLNNN